MLNQWRATYFALVLIGLSSLCLQVVTDADADTDTDEDANADPKIGVYYGNGRYRRNILSSRELISLCQKFNIKSIRLYKPNIDILQSLRNTNISVVFGIPNEELSTFYENTTYAKLWVQKYVFQFYKHVNITHITIGHYDINPLNNSTSRYSLRILIVMQKLEWIIWHFEDKIQVTTVISSKLLMTWSHPSMANFHPKAIEFMDSVIDVLDENSLFVNIPMYSHYFNDPKSVSLDYALFSSSYVLKDGLYNYTNLFDATVDAISYALEKIKDSKVVITTETGWPTAGGRGASIKNAKNFNNKLIQHVKKGTPKMPNIAIETYIFSLIDEDFRRHEYEKHFGIFYKNKIPKYKVVFPS